MLAALAEAGTAGKKAYEDAQAAVNAQKQEAIRQALSSGIAGNAPEGFQSQLVGTISQPYQSRNVQLASQQATSQDWHNRLGANANMWGTVMQGLQETVLAKALFEASLGGGGGGCGGGSGGGSGGSGGDDMIAWDDALKDTYSTLDIAKGAIGKEALNSMAGQWGQTDLAPYQFQGAYLEDMYGAPSGVGASWYPQPKDEAEVQANIGTTFKSLSGMGPRKASKNARGLITNARAVGKSLPGNQKYLVRQAKQAKKFVRKKGKKGG
jgi:hypothetical protein